MPQVLDIIMQQVFALLPLLGESGDGHVVAKHEP